MRLVLSLAFGSLLVLGHSAHSQMKEDPDGFDEEAIKSMAKLYNDRRPLEQIRKDNALIRAAGKGDLKAVRGTLKMGAQVNAYYIDGFAAFGSDGSGYTALMW